MTDVIVTLMLVYCLADVVPCGVVPPPLVARVYFCLPLADDIAIGKNNNKTNLYMVVPYHEGLSERIKRTCNKFGVQVFFIPSEASLWLPRTRILSQMKVESYIDINAVHMGVMMNTLENLLEILQKGSRNIRSPLPLYLTTVTPQVTISTSTILL